jgi:hypothetical protein
VVERMDEFEKELRDHLQARPAPAGFADGVMRRIEGRKPRRSWRFLWQPAWRWAAVAALVAMTVLGGLAREHQQRVAGERAREQVLLALRITGTTLNQVQHKVNEDQSPAEHHGHTIDLRP